MDKLVFGTSGIPASTEPKTHPNAIKQIHKLGLGGMEIELTRQVRLKKDDIPEIKRLSKELDIIITAHGPYYINLNSLIKETIEASIERAINTARLAYQCGAYSIVFHAGYNSKMKPEYVYNKVKNGFEKIFEVTDKEGIKLWIRPELTGKVSQWGELDELIRLSNEFEMVLPCIDFSHYFARYQGQHNSYDNFAFVLEKMAKEIGTYSLENFHGHISGMIYGKSGEKGHILLKETQMNYKALIKALKDFDVKGIIICESPDSEGDALILQEEYRLS